MTLAGGRVSIPPRLWMLVASGLFLGCLAVLGPARQAGQYPGSVRVSRAPWDLGLLSRAMLRQDSIYETEDSFFVVQAWYARRLRLAPAARQHLAAGCARLGQSQQILWITHSEHVLICEVPQGTRVVVQHWYALSR